MREKFPNKPTWTEKWYIEMKKKANRWEGDNTPKRKDLHATTSQRRKVLPGEGRCFAPKREEKEEPGGELASPKERTTELKKEKYRTLNHLGIRSIKTRRKKIQRYKEGGEATRLK